MHRTPRSTRGRGQVQSSIYEEHYENGRRLGPGPKTLEQICGALKLSSKGGLIKGLVKAILMFSSYRKPHLNAVGRVQPRLANGVWDANFAANVQVFLGHCGSLFFPVIQPEKWRHDFWTVPGTHPKWMVASDRATISEGTCLLFEYLRSHDHGLDLSEAEPIEDLIQLACDVCGGGKLNDGQVHKCNGCEVNYHPECCDATTPVPLTRLERNMCKPCIDGIAAKSAALAVRKEQREAAARRQEEEEAATKKDKETKKKNAKLGKGIKDIEDTTQGAISTPPIKGKPGRRKSKLSTKKKEELEDDELELGQDMSTPVPRSKATGGPKSIPKPKTERKEEVLPDHRARRTSHASVDFSLRHSNGMMQYSDEDSGYGGVASSKSSAQSESSDLPMGSAFKLGKVLAEVEGGLQINLKSNKYNIHPNNSGPLSSTSTRGPTTGTRKRPLDETVSEESEAKRRAIEPVFTDYGKGEKHLQSKELGFSRLDENVQDRFGTQDTFVSDGPAGKVQEPTVLPEKVAYLQSLLPAPQSFVAATTMSSTSTVIQAAGPTVRGHPAGGSVSLTNNLPSQVARQDDTSQSRDIGLTEAQINGTVLFLIRNGTDSNCIQVNFSEISPDSLFEVCGARFAAQYGRATTRLRLELPVPINGERWTELLPTGRAGYKDLVARIQSEWKDNGGNRLYLRLLALYDGEFV